jgi:hypothetical protein
MVKIGKKTTYDQKKVVRNAFFLIAAPIKPTNRDTIVEASKGARTPPITSAKSLGSYTNINPTADITINNIVTAKEAASFCDMARISLNSIGKLCYKFRCDSVKLPSQEIQHKQNIICCILNS